MSKSCFDCEHCYNGKECVLRDDLILGTCFMWKPRGKKVKD